MALKVAGAVASFLSMASAAVAAYLWYKSTTVKITPQSRPDGTGNPDMIVDGCLFVESAKQQSAWNKRAAIAATAAAFFQACGMLFQAI